MRDTLAHHCPCSRPTTPRSSLRDIPLTHRNETIEAGRTFHTFSSPNATIQQIAMSTQPSPCPYHAFSIPTMSGEGMLHERDLAVSEIGAQPCPRRFEDHLTELFPQQRRQSAHASDYNLPDLSRGRKSFGVLMTHEKGHGS